MRPVEIAFDAQADLGEGPVWDARAGELLWVDITAGLIHAFDPRTGADRTRDVGQPVGAVAVRRAGGLVAALRDGFATIDDAGAAALIAATEADDPTTRMNDGKVDPAGRFWAGTMALDARPGAGSLYRLEPGARVTRVLRGLTISNGMDWTADRRRMYLIDSASYGVDAFEYDDATGAIAGRRTVCRIGSADTMPDGMTLDADGRLWVAVWGGSRVRCFEPDGTPAGEVALPVSQVTSCAFGGPGLAELYITTASRGLTPEQRAREPHAGALFVCAPGPHGVPAHEFAG